jgi:hypothetical protein
MTADAPALRGSRWIYVGLLFIAFVFPVDPAAELVKRVGLPGRVYEWALVAFLALAAVLWMHAGSVLRERALFFLAYGIACWGTFLVAYALMVRGNPPINVFAAAFPYAYWMALLVPVMLGPIVSWRTVLRTLTLAVGLAGAVSTYALFFNSRLLVFLIGSHSEADLTSFLVNSFRLPLAVGHIIPLLLLGWAAMWRLHTRSFPGRAGIIALCAFLVFLVAAGQSRTLIMVLVASTIALGARRWQAKVLVGAGYALVFVTLLAASFAALTRVDPRLAARVEDRFLHEGLLNPAVALRGAYVNNRDMLYLYSWGTLNEDPILGRGMGSVIPTGGGRVVGFQDVTPLNHLDKSGLLGLLLFTCIHAYLYVRMRRSARVYLRLRGPGIEHELRLLFIRYYPFVLLTSLNIDVLYKDPFVIVHALLVGSMLVEARELERMEFAESEPVSAAWTGRPSLVGGAA